MNKSSRKIIADSSHSKYAQELKPTAFFISGMKKSMRIHYTGCDYHTPVKPRYFRENRWKNVGLYIYNGMEALENVEEKVKGTKKKFFSEA